MARFRIAAVGDDVRSPNIRLVQPGLERLLTSSPTAPERALDAEGFVLQSVAMESNWASEHLQVIRTLMERSAVYRRALAPVMAFNGVLGIVAAGAGMLAHIDSPRAFIGFWLLVAVIGVAGAFLLTRRQSLKAAEAFWSPPTRRVAQALSPPLFFGVVLGAVLVLHSGAGHPEIVDALSLRWLPLAWIALYGCALHAAGFFMPRGMKVFGWAFVLGSSAFCLLGCPHCAPPPFFGHGVMGLFFGVFHLAYGVYLYFTEPRRDEQ
jgi:hypothetical protein